MPEPDLTLVVNVGQPDEQRFPIPAGRTTTSIGRTKENDVFILHKSLSRRHAQLEIARGVVEVVDLRSKNGTFVNGVRSERVMIRPGDAFKCGDIVFRLVALGAALDDARVGSRRPRDDGLVPTLVCDPFTQYPRSSIDGLLSPPSSKSALRDGAGALDSAERAHDKLRILLEVSQLLSSPSVGPGETTGVGADAGIDRLLEKILALVFRILDVDRGAILMRDRATGELCPRVVKTSAGPPNAGRFYSQHIVGWVRDHGVAALFSDAKLDPRLGTAVSILDQSICASMCAPLKPKDELLGVLYVDNLSTANRFTEEDLGFLTAFANQAAIALENSILYRRIEEEAVLRNTYLRFFPPATIRKMELAGRDPSAWLDVIETDVTALFADISDFTSMSSTMQPRQIVDMLNEYFPVMADVVFRHEGTLEKYIGDALMAVWGAPFSHEDDTDRAVRAAIEMHQALARLNERWRARAHGAPEIRIHIGLNSGRVAAGNIGSERYLQYATIGDATNVASRVCGVARAGEIVITENTLSRLRERPARLEPLPPATLKGKDLPIALYKVGWLPRVDTE